MPRLQLMRNQSFILIVLSLLGVCGIAIGLVGWMSNSRQIVAKASKTQPDSVGGGGVRSERSSSTSAAKDNDLSERELELRSANDTGSSQLSSTGPSADYPLFFDSTAKDE